MEQNLPLVAKRVWSLVRAMLFIIRKNISKRRLLLDLNMMIRRGKIAGKALQNLMFHHHSWSASAFNRRQHGSPQFTFPPSRTQDYEFSCSNSPNYPLSHDLFTTRKKHNYKNSSQKKPTIIDVDQDHEISVDPAVIKALEMLTASPALPGFGRTPKVRQLRITDSPFPLSNGEEDSYVDEAAEKFIMKFYNNLRRQS